MSKPKLLVIEDDAALCAQYRWSFSSWRVVIANDRAQAEAAAAKEDPAVALLDLGLPPDPEGVSEGFATLEALRKVSPMLPVIVSSGQDQRENALRAIALGAYDFCPKPADLAMLRTVLDRALRLRELEEENLRLAAAPRPSPVRDIITGDEGMLKVCRTVERLASVSVPVLLLGDSGTGKEALARALHEMGPRAKKEFVAINCAAIPETLLESELFGHEKGAFTGAVRQVTGRVEAANGGTLFLDEIGDLPASLQAKLLRFLQDQTFERVGGRSPIRVDVRVVSATNQPLEDNANEGRFRGDLLYRLNGVTVRIPPLRDRGDDALLLARWFLARESMSLGRKNRGFDAGALAAIAAHPWPGNVRELQNRVRRGALMADGPLIAAEDLELEAPAEEDRGLIPEVDFDLRAARMRAERETVERALAHSNGSVSAAARLLGVSRPTLYGLLDTHGMAPHRPGTDPGADPGSDAEPEAGAQDGGNPPGATLDAV